MTVPGTASTMAIQGPALGLWNGPGFALRLGSFSLLSDAFVISKAARGPDVSKASRGQPSSHPSRKSMAELRKGLGQGNQHLASVLAHARKHVKPRQV